MWCSTLRRLSKYQVFQSAGFATRGRKGMKLIFAGHEVVFGCYRRQLPMLGSALSRLSAFRQLSSEASSSSQGWLSDQPGYL
jgi:hypothetical protein